MNPFDQLADQPADQASRTPGPNARFVERLRRQIEAEFTPDISLAPRKEQTMTDTSTPATTTPTATQVITPYISVHDGAAALDWYVTALGATETVRYVGDDGRLGHAEFVLHGATVMLSDAYPEIGVVAANSYEGSSCALHVNVPNCDETHDLAVGSGATSLSSPADQPHGARSATIMDPFGHRWMLSQAVHALTNAEIDANYDDFTVQAAAAPTRPIQLGYYTIQSDDITRSAAFYSELFGWNVDPASGHVDNCDLPFGFQDKSDDEFRLWMSVDDPDAVVARVLELGGSVLEDTNYASGRAVACEDDQGHRFDIHKAAPGYE